MDSKKVFFKSLLIKTDVTALKILNENHVLVGIGNTLNLYNIPTKCLISSEEVFLGQKIHGIVPSDCKNKIAIFGGKQIRICKINFDNSDPHITIDKNHINCDDWILTLIWSKNESCLSILTAHNVVQTWDVHTTELQECFKCAEKCILYSGLLKESNDKIIIFAGTVFSQIVIWSTDSEKINKRLTGHKGVIFSISYCNINNIIVTSSDDRSVKIWSIKSDKNIDDENFWSEAEVLCNKTLFGHTARVMRNLIAGSYVVSIGEDSIMCVWDMEGNLLQKRRIHKDGCLWSLDCCANCNIIVTGGNDSGVMIHRLIPDCENAQSENILKFHITDLKPKIIAVTARNNIVCLTEQGELVYYIVEDGYYDIIKSEKFKPNSMSLSKCKQLIALTDINGNLNIFIETCRFEKLIQYMSEKVCNEKMLSLSWLSNRNVCVCDSKGVIAIWGSNGDTCLKLNEFQLPSCKERWLTVADVISLYGDCLIVGDRCGNIHLYENGAINPIQTINKVHGRLGINFMKIDGNKIITCGRDGSVKHFSINKENNKLQLHHLYSVKIPFNWVDRFIGRADSVVCGFRETDLIVWDMKDSRILFEINCGGGHRSWDINKFNDIYQLIYIKNSQIHKLDFPIKNISQYMISGYHVKEINSLVVLKNNNDYNIISGGEDTTIIFNQCKINSKNITFNNQYKIDKHLSSIRCLNLYENGEKKILFSAGGRAQLCVWELKPDIKTDSILEIKEIANHMLKGTDYERKGNSNWKNVQIDTEAETRFMSLTSLNSSNFKYLDTDEDVILFIGCSDGFLRAYLINSEINLLGSFNYNSKCILRVHSIIFNSHPVVFTMSVNGAIAIWDFQALGNTEEFQPVYNFTCHKAGINSFDISHVVDGKFLIATGGDDNDIQLNIISLSIESNTLKIEKIYNWHNDKYHCSQVSGIKLLNNQYLLSTSIDQRITILRLLFDKNTLVDIECEFYGQYHVSISDIQGMTILNHDRNEILACIYGMGMEIIQINLQPQSIN